MKFSNMCISKTKLPNIPISHMVAFRSFIWKHLTIFWKSVHTNPTLPYFQSSVKLRNINILNNYCKSKNLLNAKCIKKILDLGAFMLHFFWNILTLLLRTKLSFCKTNLSLQGVAVTIAVTIGVANFQTTRHHQTTTHLHTLIPKCRFKTKHNSETADKAAETFYRHHDFWR